MFTRMMEGLAAVGAEPKTVMIDATYLKAHRTASSLRVKKGVTVFDVPTFTNPATLTRLVGVGMAWTVPEFEPQEVNAAGKALGWMAFPVDTLEGLEALGIINNWRSSHACPLNTFQITLRDRARRIGRNVVIAQREKRLDSTHRKLVAKTSMRMTQMQDIAGCRAVFTKLSDVGKPNTGGKPPTGSLGAHCRYYRA